MKNMKKQIIQFLGLVSLFIAAGCGDEVVDVTAPTMNVNAYTPAPVEAEVCGTIDPMVFQLKGGDVLGFDVIFEDDEALSQYKIDIHNNFDCHGHGGGNAPSVVTPNVENQTTDWTVLNIENISGQSMPVDRSFDVPENVTAGNYHFQIQIVDESGNDNPTGNIFTLKIRNPLDETAPQIIVTEPLNAGFSVAKGASIQFSGQVTDERSLSDGGNGVLFLSYTDLNSGNTFITDQVFVFDQNVETVYDFDFEYTVPQTLVAGDYRFSLGANDGVRNVATFRSFEVEVTN